MPYVGQKPADIISTAVDTVTGKFSGEVDAASLDISGNIDVDGTTNLDVVDIDGAVNMATTLLVTGETTLQTHLNMGDNDIIKLGAGNDFELFSDGSNGVLKAPNLDLYLQSDSKIRLTSEGNSETLAIFNKDGAVELYHNNVKKLSTEGSGIQILGATNDVARIAFGDSDDVDIGFISYNNGDNHMQFGTDTAEAMRINSSQQVLINTSSTLGANQGVLHLKGATNNTVCVVQTVSNGEKGFDFYNSSGSRVGFIAINASDTTFSTSSDYRLKENVVTEWDATTRLKQLKPSRFNFIVDSDTTVDGFLAHEVQSVVPEAITGTHNEVDDDDNPVMQGIDQSKLVPLLTKALQEQQATIEALTARIVTLENA